MHPYGQVFGTPMDFCLQNTSISGRHTIKTQVIDGRRKSKQKKLPLNSRTRTRVRQMKCLGYKI